MSGTLYIVATPIGNMGDLTTRVGETLANVDFILAEDTRVTWKILQHLNLTKKVIPYTEHSSDEKNQRIIEALEEGSNYALVSDAGTPCVSDPGSKIVDLALQAGISVIPIVGPSAVTALASVFGRPLTSMHFWGFFPTKLKKQTALLKFFRTVPGLHVFFESPYRILKIFEKHLLNLEDAQIMIGREMTKKFETYTRGTPQEVFEIIKNQPIKGEFCVGVMIREGEGSDEEFDDESSDRAMDEAAEDLSED